MQEFQKTFSIGDAAKWSGASQKQIRHWEARGYIPTADRVVSGERAYRRFTRDQVQLIGKIKQYLDEGFILSSAAAKATGKNPAVKEGSSHE
jgi:DNA-binding transcriptional MerR regulator